MMEQAMSPGLSGAEKRTGNAALKAMEQFFWSNKHACLYVVPSLSTFPIVFKCDLNLISDY